MKDISRRKFVKMAGATLAGVSLAGISAMKELGMGTDQYELVSID